MNRVGFRILLVLSLCPLSAIAQRDGQKLEIRSTIHISTKSYSGGKLSTVLDGKPPNDTMRVWSTHADPTHPPNFPPTQATHVAWCRADLYPHSTHLFPGAKTVYHARQGDYVYWMTEEGVETVNESMDGSLNVRKIGAVQLTP